MRLFLFAVVPLGVALVVLIEAVRVLYSSKKPDRPMLLALALYIAGIAFAANVLYVWRTTLSIRISVVLMLVMAGLLTLYSGLRGISFVKQLLPARPAHVVTGFAGIALIILATMAVLWPIPSGVALGLPVAEGTWLVFHGGAFGMANHHMRVPEQRYALDIIMVPGSLGSMLQAQGLLPGNYHAWGQVVLAPIEGVIVAVVDGLEDNTVGTRDKNNPAGNHVIIETPERIHILMSHLKQGSIVVKEEQEVTKGDVLGRVGNSGNSSEPHLHIQAMKQDQDWAWVGIPMYFDGRTPRRGHLMRAESVTADP